MPGPWTRAAAGAGLIGAGGRVAPTIFTEMSALASRTGALNLGQGFPDDPGPRIVHEAAVEAIRQGRNQYPPLPGIPELREAIAEHQRRFRGLEVDPDTEIQVTMGATEAMAAALLALVGPGDEVVTLDPFYDAYGAIIALTGATQRCAPLALTRDEGGAPTGFALDADALRAAVSDRTRAIIVNSPHNPTGMVLNAEELRDVVELAVRHDAWVLSDEVYEHLTFDAPHIPAARAAADLGAADRVVSISSAGKTFSVTGWKIGWVTASPDLIEAIRAVKQFLTFAGGGPFQEGVAAGLGADDAVFEDARTSLRARRDLLVEGLAAAGFDVLVPAGGYFTIADATPLGYLDGADLCRRMPAEIGVAAVPVSAFTRPDGPDAARLRPLVRFAQCKSEAVLREAIERLARLPHR